MDITSRENSFGGSTLWKTGDITSLSTRVGGS